jgi:hypothetical protein
MAADGQIYHEIQTSIPQRRSYHLIVDKMGIKDKISYRNYPKKGAEHISKNHRWVVERTFAWFQLKFKRLVIRWEEK